MNRGTSHNIYIFRQILELANEYNIQIDILFIDLKQVFDIIYSHGMIKILQLQGIPSKLIRLIRMTQTLKQK
jgi:hypothetical protein